MLNNWTNINRTNNYFYPQIIELKKWEQHADGNPVMAEDRLQNGGITDLWDPNPSPTTHFLSSIIWGEK
jgi:hypothetical protein